MFDIGFQELLLIGVLALLIMGPERLPGAIRTTSLFVSKLRRSFQQIKTEIEREVGTDELKQTLHNESIMQNLESAKHSIDETVNNLNPDIEKLTENLQYDIEEVIEPHPDYEPSQDPSHPSYLGETPSEEIPDDGVDNNSKLTSEKNTPDS